MDNRILVKGYVLASGANIGYKVGYKRFYFVLTNCLRYYETEESFQSGSKPIDILTLDAFSILKIEARGKFRLFINAFVFFCIR